MLVKKRFRVLFIMFILVVNIGCDQVSKSIVRKSIEPYQQFRFLDDHLLLTRVENKGAFLSVGNTLTGTTRLFVLMIVPSIAIALFLMYLVLNANVGRSSFLGIGLIIGGGVGNLYDRFLYGAVTDFLHVDLGFLRTGIFNVADVSIMFGAFLVMASGISNKTELLMQKDW